MKRLVRVREQSGLGRRRGTGATRTRGMGSLTLRVGSLDTHPTPESHEIIVLNFREGEGTVVPVEGVPSAVSDKKEWRGRRVYRSHRFGMVNEKDKKRGQSEGEGRNV